MAALQGKRSIAASLVVLAGAAVLLLVVLPPERTLGAVVKTVFLHGVLVQVGLFAFLAAGVLGVVYLLWRKPEAHSWGVAVQWVAVLIWIVYALSSMLATYQAWGQWIAWDEPRVRASFHVLWFSVACLLTTRWINERLFTAVANVVVAGMVWYLIKGASIFRHPFDPIGESTSAGYRSFFIALMAVVALFVVQLVRWIHLTRQEP